MPPRRGDSSRRTRSAVFGDATELRENSGRSGRVVKQQFPEVTLRLGGLEERVRASIGQPRLRKVGIVRRHHQFLDATDLLVDEPAQLGGAVALGGRDAAREQGVATRRGPRRDRRESEEGGWCVIASDLRLELTWARVVRAVTSMPPGATGYVGMLTATGFEGALASSFVFADQELAAVDVDRAWGNARTGLGNRWNSQSSGNR